MFLEVCVLPIEGAIGIANPGRTADVLMALPGAVLTCGDEAQDGGHAAAPLQASHGNAVGCPYGKDAFGPPLQGCGFYWGRFSHGVAVGWRGKCTFGASGTATRGLGTSNMTDRLKRRGGMATR